MPHVAVRITNDDGGTALVESAFEYTYPQPSISSVSPNTGPVNGGTQVTITGTGFRPGCVVEFGGKPAAVLSVTSTSLVCVTPPAI